MRAGFRTRAPSQPLAQQQQQPHALPHLLAHSSPLRVCRHLLAFSLLLCTLNDVKQTVRTRTCMAPMVAAARPHRGRFVYAESSYASLEHLHPSDQPPPPSEPYDPDGYGSGSAASQNTYSVKRRNVSVQGIVWEPQVLRFTANPVCIPAVSDFSVTNVATEAVELFSIVSSAPQFHPVLFQPTVLAPGEKLDMRLLFLPYFVGNIDGVLTLTSSIGEFTYEVIGDSVLNPYKLFPFVGQKIPSGVPYEQPIVLFNPTEKVLQVREIFTTEQFLGLRLHEDTSDANTSQWYLEPKASREIIRLVMTFNTPGQYQGYVHVKTDHDNMVVPVDLQVVEGGLQADPNDVDFGCLTGPDQKRHVAINLKNHGTEPVCIIDVGLDTPDPSLSWAVDNTLEAVHPGEERLTLLLNYEARRPGRSTGRLTLYTNHTNPTLAAIPIKYSAAVVYGSLTSSFESTLVALPQTHYALNLSNDLKPFHYKLNLSNLFHVPLIMLSATLTTCNDFVKLIQAPVGVLVQPQEEWDPLVLNIDPPHPPRQTPSILPISCEVNVTTNLTSHPITIQLHDGSLRFDFWNFTSLETFMDATLYVFSTYLEQLENASQAPAILSHRSNFSSQSYVLHIGRIAINTPRFISFSVHNPNPVRVEGILDTQQDPCLLLERAWINIDDSPVYDIRSNASGGPSVSMVLPPLTSLHIEVSFNLHANASGPHRLRFVSSFQTLFFLVECAEIHGELEAAYAGKDVLLLGSSLSVPLQIKSSIPETVLLHEVTVDQDLYNVAIEYSTISGLSNAVAATLKFQGACRSLTLWGCLRVLRGVIDAPEHAKLLMEKVLTMTEKYSADNNWQITDYENLRLSLQDLAPHLRLKSANVTLHTDVGSFTSVLAAPALTFPVQLGKLKALSIPNVTPVGLIRKFFVQIRNTLDHAVEISIENSSTMTTLREEPQLDTDHTAKATISTSRIDGLRVDLVSEGQIYTSNGVENFVFGVSSGGFHAKIVHPGEKVQVGPFWFKSSAAQVFESSLVVVSNFTGPRTITLTAEGGAPAFKVSRVVDENGAQICHSDHQNDRCNEFDLVVTERMSEPITIWLDNYGNINETLLSIQAAEWLGYRLCHLGSLKVCDATRSMTQVPRNFGDRGLSLRVNESKPISVQIGAHCAYTESTQLLRFKGKSSTLQLLVHLTLSPEAIIACQVREAINTSGTIASWAAAAVLATCLLLLTIMQQPWKPHTEFNKELSPEKIMLDFERSLLSATAVPMNPLRYGSVTDEVDISAGVIRASQPRLNYLPFDTKLRQRPDLSELRLEHVEMLRTARSTQPNPEREPIGSDISTMQQSLPIAPSHQHKQGSTSNSQKHPKNCINSEEMIHSEMDQPPKISEPTICKTGGNSIRSSISHEVAHLSKLSAQDVDAENTSSWKSRNHGKDFPPPPGLGQKEDDINVVRPTISDPYVLNEPHIDVDPLDESGNPWITRAGYEQRSHSMFGSILPWERIETVNSAQSFAISNGMMEPTPGDSDPFADMDMNWNKLMEAALGPGLLGAVQGVSASSPESLFCSPFYAPSPPASSPDMVASADTSLDSLHGMPRTLLPTYSVKDEAKEAIPDLHSLLSRDEGWNSWLSSPTIEAAGNQAHRENLDPTHLNQVAATETGSQDVRNLDFFGPQGFFQMELSGPGVCMEELGGNLESEDEI